MAALLKDKSGLVRLNATTAYIALKDPSVESALISRNSSSTLIRPCRAKPPRAAALMAEGSDTARTVVRRSVSVSLSVYAKMTAAKLLADTKDPKMAEDVSLLISNRSWLARVFAVEALAEIPTRESQIFFVSLFSIS